LQPNEWWARGTHQQLTGLRALVGNWVLVSVANLAVSVNVAVGRPTRSCRLGELLAVEEGAEQVHQSGEAFGRDLPDDGVVDCRVAVDEDVADATMRGRSAMLAAVSGSTWHRRLSDSPMISNWRSTADRSIGSSR